MSRQTVRQAVSQLTQIGMIERQRGRGSTVLRTEFEQPLGSIYSLFGAVEARGVEQRSDVLELATTVDRDIAHHLGLPPDEALISLSRLRRAGETPLALDHVWLPATIAAPLLDVDFSHTGLYDELPRSVWRRDRRGVRAHPARPARRRPAATARPRQRGCGRVPHRTERTRRRPRHRVSRESSCAATATDSSSTGQPHPSPPCAWPPALDGAGRRYSAEVDTAWCSNPVSTRPNRRSSVG